MELTKEEKKSLIEEISKIDVSDIESLINKYKDYE